MATEYMGINELKEFDCNIFASIKKKNTKPSPACRSGEYLQRNHKNKQF